MGYLTHCVICEADLQDTHEDVMPWKRHAWILAKNVLQSFNGFLLLAGIRIQTRSQKAVENEMHCRPRDVIVIPALLMCVPVSVCEYYLNSRLHYIHGYYISQKHKSTMTKIIIPIWCIYGKRSCGKYSLFLTTNIAHETERDNLVMKSA